MRLTILCANPNHAGADTPLAIQDVAHVSQAMALLCEMCHEALRTTPNTAQRVWAARVQGGGPPAPS